MTSIWNWLIDLIIRYAKRDPYFHLKGYMERYWILRYRSWQPYSIRVHHILRSDLDRHLHDHPWTYASLILRGGYFEVTEDADGYEVAKWYGPGSFRIRGAKSRHRLILPEGTTTWSLFFMGRKAQTWGFYTPRGKVPWRDYLSGSDVAAAEAAYAELS